MITPTITTNETNRRTVSLDFAGDIVKFTSAVGPFITDERTFTWTGKLNESIFPSELLSELKRMVPDRAEELYTFLTKQESLGVRAT